MVISTGTIIRTVLVLVGFWFLFIIREVVGMMLVAILLAALLDPIAEFFEKRKIPRSISVIAVYLIIFVLLGVLLVAIIPPMIEQVRGVIVNFGSLWQKVVNSFEALRSISARYGLEANFQNSVRTLSDTLEVPFANLFATVGSVFSGIFSFFIILVISFFLVVEKNSIRGVVTTLIPPQHQDYVHGLTARMQRKVGQWLIGQLVLMLFVGVLAYIGLLVFGVDYALLLAVIAGVTEIIPYVGPVIGAVPAVFFAAAQSPTKGIIVLALYFVIQRIENMILVPKVMQKTTGLNPVLAIVSIAIGYIVGGIAGVLLSIPVATALNVLLSDYMERQSRQTA